MKNRILVIFFGVCLLAFLGRFAINILKPRPRPMPPVVSTTTIQKETQIQKLDLAGRVISKYSANIKARVQGILQKKYFEEGAFVKKGQLLFLIEPNQYIIAKNQALANVSNAKATLIESEKNLTRVAELVEKDFVSKSQYDKALAKRDVDKANLKSAKARLADAKLNLSYTRIKAPINGRIGNLAVTEGNLVDIQTPSLATIMSLDPVYVSFDISSRDYLALRKSIKENDAVVEITLPDETTYEEKGHLDFHNNRVDELTGTVKLRATFKNPDQLLLPGQFVDTKITFGKPKEVFTLEQELVMQNPKGFFVFTLNNENKATITPVKIGEAIDNKWIITEGLNETDKVISSNLQNIRPGMPLKIKEIENTTKEIKE